MKSPHQRLLHYVRGHLPSFSAAIALSVLVGLLEAVTAFLVSAVFDTFLGKAITPALALPVVDWRLNFGGIDRNVLLALLVATTILKAVAEYGGVVTSGLVGQGVVRDLRNDVFDKILHQPLQFFQSNPTGELVSRISTDIERIQTAASETLAEFLKQSATTICLVIAVFIIDWRLSTASFILVPLVLLMTASFGRKLRRLSRSNQQDMAAMANVTSEAFAGNRIVKAFQMEGAETSRFRAITDSLFRVSMRQRMTHALSSPLMEILGVCLMAGFVIYAQARMTGGLLVGFLVALVRLYDGIRRMSGINNSFQQAFGASERIFEILSLDGEKDTGHVELSGFSDSVEFQSVQFSYGPSAPVLDDVSFRIHRGEVLAIVGPSGAGKSTLVSLVPRFFHATAGSIRIDGVDLEECSLSSLRRQIAVVTQDVILFDDTILANIAYGDPQASREDVVRAAKAALVDDFVALLPEGYMTRVGERGLRLSGGERQRISIARALLKNAPILILDEATSSLDAESEDSVQRALQNLMEGRTTIVIAHRLSTVRSADRIIVLADGRIQESGAHEALVTRRGLYWKLYSLQFPESVEST